MKNLMITIITLLLISCSEYDRHKFSYNIGYIVESDSLIFIELDSLIVITSNLDKVQKELIKLKNGPDTLTINKDVIKITHSFVVENGEKTESSNYYELIDPNNKICAKLRVIDHDANETFDNSNDHQTITYSGDISRFPNILKKDLIKFKYTNYNLLSKAKLQSKGKVYDFGTLKETNVQ